MHKNNSTVTVVVLGKASVLTLGSPGRYWESANGGHRPSHEPRM